MSTISKKKNRSRPQSRPQGPRPTNKGYGDAGASYQKKATKGFRAMSGSPKEDIDALLPKVKMVLDIVERVCTAQIDYYAQQAAR